MSRRRRPREHTRHSLFPFLSVLACTIGVLTLLISVVALEQLQSPKARYQEISRQRALAQSQAAEYQRRIRDAAVAEKQLISERERLATANNIDLNFPTDYDAVLKLAAKLRQAEIAVDELERRVHAARGEISALDEKIAARRHAITDPGIRLIPGQDMQADIPTFIECDGAGLILHERDNSAPTRVQKSAIATSSALSELLKTTRLRPRGKVIFLLRSDGVPSYDLAKQVTEGSDTLHGKLPVDSDGPVDLSAFY